MKAKKKEIKVICPDCKTEYISGAPHNMFCPAKTCTECLGTFSYIIPVYDPRPESFDPDGNPVRLCEECLEERISLEEEEEF